MEYPEILQQLRKLTDEELSKVDTAIRAEQMERDPNYQTFEEAGLAPLYRCQVPEHCRWGLYAENPDRPGRLICGCPVGTATLEAWE